MTDVMTPEQRHRCMSHIRSKNTKPEMIVRKYLFAQGFRYRLHVKSLPGTPDIVLRKYRTVIFVNGCFWHGHEGCKYAKLPEQNRKFWEDKIKGNIERDKNVRIILRDMGWHTIIIWQCQLKKKVRQDYLKSLAHTINKIFLINYGSKTYMLNSEENNTPLAAEDANNYK